MTTRILRPVVGLAALAAVVAIWLDISTRGLATDVGPEAVAITFLVLASQLAGWQIGGRPSRGWTGLAVQVCGAAAPLGYARFIGYASPAGRGNVVLVAAAVWLTTSAVPAFLGVHPSRAGGRRLTVIAGTAIAATAAAGAVVLGAAHGVTRGSSTWWSIVPVRPAAPAAHRAYAVHAVLLTIAVGSAMVGVGMASLWDRRAPAASRGHRPVAWCTAVWAVAALASEWAGLAGPAWAIDTTSGGLTRTALLVLGLLPVVATEALVAALVWRDVIVPARSHVGSDVTGEDLRTSDVAAYLARALADPSVRVMFGDGTGGWVDHEGRPTVAGRDPDRLTTTLVRDGVLLGAIECDPSLASEPEAIELVATPAGLAIDTERLASLARARVREAQQLTSRLLTSSDAARDQLRAELDAGPVRELDELSEELRTAPDLDLDRVATRLRQISEDVRAVSRGLLPPELATGGLASALPDASSAPSRRLPEAVEVTAFLLADGQQGARVVDEGPQLVIDLGRPPTEAGVLDRIEVLGGSVTGSTVTLPIESGPP